MLYEKDLEAVAMREQAKKHLEKYKKIEKGFDLHECRINSKTIVYCKNKENIDKYKRKEKESIVCLTD